MRRPNWQIALVLTIVSILLTLTAGSALAQKPARVDLPYVAEFGIVHIPDHAPAPVVVRCSDLRGGA